MDLLHGYQGTFAPPICRYNTNQIYMFYCERAGNEVCPWKNGFFSMICLMIWNVHLAAQYPFEASTPNSPIRLLKRLFGVDAKFK
jgi:hypothetical protein